MSEYTSIKDMAGMEPGTAIQETTARVGKSYPPRDGKQMVSLFWYEKGSDKANYITAFVSGSSVDFQEHEKEVVTFRGGNMVLISESYKDKNYINLSIDGAEVSFKGSAPSETPKPSEPPPAPLKQPPVDISADGGPNGNAKDKQIITQAYLKSIIEAGTPKNDCEEFLRKAFEIHNKYNP